MTTFNNMFKNMMMIGLIIFSILSLGFIVQEENDAEEQFKDNSLISKTFDSLESDLGNLRNQSQSQKTLFESENPTSGFGTILLFSIVSAGKVFNSMMIGVFNVIIELPVVFLGLDPLVVSVISAIFIIMIILGLWAVYKLGG